MAAAVRGSSVVGGSGVTSLDTGSFTSATGDTIGVWFNYGVSTDPTSVTDNNGNTYTQRGKVSRAGGFTAFLYTCENATGGAGTIVTLNIGFTEYPTLAAVAMSGVLTSSVLDVLTTEGADTSQPWTLSSGTLAQADEIVFGFVGSDSGGSSDTFTEGSGMTKLGEVVDSNLYWTGALAYVVVSATTARVQSWTNSGGGSNSTQLVSSFKASGGGGGPTTTDATAAAGVATVSGVGSSNATTSGSAAGTATVSAAGASTAVTTASAAAGAATVSATGAAASATTATPAAGTSVVSGVGSSTSAGVATAIPAAGVATVSALARSIAATTAVPAAGTSTVGATTPDGAPDEPQESYSTPAKKRRWNYDYSSPKEAEVKAVEPAKPVKAVTKKAKKVIPADVAEMMQLLEASQSVTAEVLAEQMAMRAAEEQRFAEEEELMAVIALCL